MVFLKKCIFLCLAILMVECEAASAPAPEEYLEEKWVDVGPSRRVWGGQVTRWREKNKLSLFKLASLLARRTSFFQRPKTAIVETIRAEVDSVSSAVLPIIRNYNFNPEEKDKIINVFLKTPPEERGHYSQIVGKVFPQAAKGEEVTYMLYLLRLCVKPDDQRGEGWDPGFQRKSAAQEKDFYQDMRVRSFRNLPADQRWAVAEGLAELNYKNIIKPEVLSAAIKALMRLPVLDSVERIKNLLKHVPRDGDARYLEAVFRLIAYADPANDGLLKHNMDNALAYGNGKSSLRSTMNHVFVESLMGLAESFQHTDTDSQKEMLEDLVETPDLLGGKNLREALALVKKEERRNVKCVLDQLVGAKIKYVGKQEIIHSIQAILKIPIEERQEVISQIKAFCGASWGEPSGRHPHLGVLDIFSSLTPPQRCFWKDYLLSTFPSCGLGDVIYYWKNIVAFSDEEREPVESYIKEMLKKRCSKIEEVLHPVACVLSRIKNIEPHIREEVFELSRTIETTYGFSEAFALDYKKGRRVYIQRCLTKCLYDRSRRFQYDADFLGYLPDVLEFIRETLGVWEHKQMEEMKHQAEVKRKN